MTALADVQRALNLIRQITSEERAAVRLEVLRLMASAIADEARSIEQSTLSKQKQRLAVPPVPIPKSPNVSKLPQVMRKSQPASQSAQPNRPKPPKAIKPIKPIQPIKPIAPK